MNPILIYKQVVFLIFKNMTFILQKCFILEMYFVEQEKNIATR